jgi:predicted phage terminase large subunit-like protein
VDGTETLQQVIGKGANRAVSNARKSFWDYLKYINPNFFRDDRPHLKTLAETLQAAFERKLLNPDGSACRKIIINLPPRMGKSYTLTLFNQWALGRDQGLRIISVSYNETLSSRFAKGVRDGIDATKIDQQAHIFGDVFPGVHIKYGDGAAQLWALEGQFFNFLATGFGGTITGVGCSIGIIDDPVKNHIEAANELALDDQFAWYNDTFFSRLEEGALQIIVMTRWATGDLAGRLLARDADGWKVLCMPACISEETHEMLCPSILSWDRWQQIKKTTSEQIVLANYQQQPIDIKGRMYDRFTTYTQDEIPRRPDGMPAWEKILSYTDTADTGADYTCSLIAGQLQGRLWMLDVLYSDRGMDVTEPLLADMLVKHQVNEAWIESNNGGRGFARNVERLMWERKQWRMTRIVPHPQRQNKEARILVAAPYVMDNILFPRDWADRWPEYYRAMFRHQRTGRNAHDDAPDATTGLAELITGGMTGRTTFASGRGRRR